MTTHTCRYFLNKYIHTFIPMREFGWGRLLEVCITIRSPLLNIFWWKLEYYYSHWSQGTPFHGLKKFYCIFKSASDSLLQSYAGKYASSHKRSKCGSNHFPFHLSLLHKVMTTLPPLHDFVFLRNIYIYTFTFTFDFNYYYLSQKKEEKRDQFFFLVAG